MSRKDRAKQCTRNNAATASALRETEKNAGYEKGVKTYLAQY